MKERIPHIILMCCCGMGGLVIMPIVLSVLHLVYTVSLLLVIFAIVLGSNLFLLEARLWFPYETYLPYIAERVLGKVFGGLTRITYATWYYFLIAGYFSTGIFLLEQVIFQGVDTLFNRILCVLPLLAMGLATFYFFYRKKLAWAWILVGIESVCFIILLPLALMRYEPSIILQHINLKGLKETLPLLLLLFPSEILMTRLKRDYSNDIDQIKKIIVRGSIISLSLALLWLAVLTLLPNLAANFSNILLHQPQVFAASVPFAQDTMQNFIDKTSYILLIVASLGSIATLLYFGGEYFMHKNKIINSPLNFYKKLVPVCVVPLFLVFIFPHYNLVYFWYAGFIMIILFLILPILILWLGRYHYELAFGYRVRGGRFFLLFIFMLGCSLLYLSL